MGDDWIRAEIPLWSVCMLDCKGGHHILEVSLGQRFERITKKTLQGPGKCGTIAGDLMLGCTSCSPPIAGL